VDGDVSDVPGVGEVYAARLRAIGIETAADLAAADPTIVEGVEGVGPVTASRWRAAARETATSRQAAEREKAVKPAGTRVDPIGDLYTEGTWHGMPQWKCKLCPWDTLKSEAVIRDHVVRAHVLGPEEEEAKKAKPQILVAKR